MLISQFTGTHPYYWCKTQPSHGFFHTQLGWFSSQALSLPLSAQNMLVKTIPKRYSKFLFFSCKLDSIISQKMVILIPCHHKLVRILFPTTTLTSFNKFFDNSKEVNIKRKWIGLI
jgi:hypothetical protein